MSLNRLLKYLSEGRSRMHCSYRIDLPALTEKELTLGKKPAAGHCDCQNSLGEWSKGNISTTC